jgi:uncharacterized membrane protein YgdD (TMEM256/DUF423 family)
MSRRWLVAAAASGFLGVLLGAFGAHALRDRLSEEARGWWETGVLYHLIHAVALLGASVVPGRDRLLLAARAAFLAGVVVFSGTLYAMALGAPRALGAITPVGGVLLLLGWALLALHAVRADRPDRA